MHLWLESVWIGLNQTCTSGLCNFTPLFLAKLFWTKALPGFMGICCEQPFCGQSKTWPLERMFCSGPWPLQNILVICKLLYFCIDWAVMLCVGLLSCWKINLLPTCSSLADGIRLSTRIFRYLAAFILPSTAKRSLIRPKDIDTVDRGFNTIRFGKLDFIWVFFNGGFLSPVRFWLVKNPGNSCGMQSLSHLSCWDVRLQSSYWVSWWPLSLVFFLHSHSVCTNCKMQTVKIQTEKCSCFWETTETLTMRLECVNSTSGNCYSCTCSDRDSTNVTSRSSLSLYNVTASVDKQHHIRSHIRIHRAMTSSLSSSCYWVQIFSLHNHIYMNE